MAVTFEHTCGLNLSKKKKFLEKKPENKNFGKKVPIF